MTLNLTWHLGIVWIEGNKKEKDTSGKARKGSKVVSIHFIWIKYGRKRKKILKFCKEKGKYQSVSELKRMKKMTFF